MKLPFYALLVLGLSLGLEACTGEQDLPILGHKTYTEGKDEKGQTVRDSQPLPLPNFRLLNQEGAEVTEALRQGKVAVVDFFFTSCPSICPKVKKQMLRLQEAYAGQPDFIMLSHSIDAKRDSVPRLRWYADKLGVKLPTWHLLYGEYEVMEELARGYLLSALEDAQAPGGFDHSGALCLIDRQVRIRGLYEGTDPKRVDQLLVDIKRLLDGSSQ